MPNKIELLLFPFNGNAFEALDCIDYNKYNFIGFIDDNVEKQGKHSSGFEIYNRDILNNFKNAKVLAVPGSPATYKNRSEIISELNISNDRFATIIHPKATISKYAIIGFNCLIMAGVVVTSNAVIGNHVCILPNSVIHHDTEIGDYTLIGSNVTIAGYSKVGRKCYLGSCSSIINNIEVGDGSLLGIGTNLINSISANSKIVGNPGRSIL